MTQQPEPTWPVTVDPDGTSRPDWQQIGYDRQAAISAAAAELDGAATVTFDLLDNGTFTPLEALAQLREHVRTLHIVRMAAWAPSDAARATERRRRDAAAGRDLDDDAVTPEHRLARAEQHYQAAIQRVVVLGAIGGAAYAAARSLLHAEALDEPGAVADVEREITEWSDCDHRGDFPSIVAHAASCTRHPVLEHPPALYAAGYVAQPGECPDGGECGDPACPAVPDEQPAYVPQRGEPGHHGGCDACGGVTAHTPTCEAADR